MPNLAKAYQVAKGMGRNPTLVIPFSVVDAHEKVSEFGNDLHVIRGEIEGSQAPYKCVITLPKSKNLSHARWYCSCDDFRFTFHPHIDGNGHALLPFPEYIPNGRGQPRAIGDYGMCKHLMAVCNTLVETRVLLPSQFLE